MNKKVLVTGGSRGIGLAVVKLFASNGYNVVATYNKSRPTETLENVIYKKLDLTNSIEVTELIEFLKTQDLMPSILVNNAGIAKDKMFHKMSSFDWSDVIDLNLKSIFNITQPIYTKMREDKFGRIINISSVNAKKGQIGQVNYCAAKAGIIGFTKALALEGANYGITVNTVSPGYTQTDMMAAINPVILSNIVDSIPLKRLADAQEIASLVFYISQEGSGYITGADYDINGGLYV